jgi:hypothetical protein
MLQRCGPDVTQPELSRRSNHDRGSGGRASVVQAVTVIMGVVVGRTFRFGFGNILNLARHGATPISWCGTDVSYLPQYL